MIGRLPAAAGIERGPVQHDALIGVSEQNSGVPLADRRVFEVEAVRGADTDSLARSWM